jgi:hypothetical protein
MAIRPRDKAVPATYRSAAYRIHGQRAACQEISTSKSDRLSATFARVTEMLVEHAAEEERPIAIAHVD